MRKGHIAGIGFAFLVAASHHGVAAHESFGEGFCELARGTGVILGCDVRDADRKVVTLIHASRAEAAWMCRGITDIMKGRGAPSDVWRLSLHSPFERRVPLASCLFDTE